MALDLSFGGDNEYVAMAQRAAESSGGPSIIASLLDAVGIGRQKAKEPKKSESKTAAQAVPVDPILLPGAGGINSFSNQPITAWGQQYLDSLKPLVQFDPTTLGR